MRALRGLRQIAVRRLLARTVSVALMMTLLVVQTPAAAAQLLVADAVNMQANTAFWFVASGWRESLIRTLSGQDPRPKTQKPEKQKDRDGRVAQLEISPGGANLSIPVDGRIQFVALAADAQGAPVSGVKTRWSVQAVERGKRSQISPRGEFHARQVGTYTVTAEAAGQSASVQVQVTPGAPPVIPGVTPVITKSVSSRRPTATSSAAKSVETADTVTAEAAGASTANMIEPEQPIWNDDNSPSFDDPGNQIGDPPGSPADDGAGNGNFQLAAPVIGLEGRGIDLALALAYNSRVWNKAGSEISFDIDRGFPAPGWSVGFGKLSFMGIRGGSMLSEADGTRHGYGGELSYSNFSQCTGFPVNETNIHTCRNITVEHFGRTTDGTFIDYKGKFVVSGGAVVSGEGRASLPNGTGITYGAFNQGAVYPTRIEDANGNFIIVTYRNVGNGDKGPHISTITDTLGRSVQFHYDEGDPAANRLTAITAPGFNGAGRRVLVRLVYQPLTLNYGFSGLSVRAPANGSSITVLKAIYYPGTNTGYWFGDADAYSSYGMLKKVVEQRAMSFAGDVNHLTTPGDVYAGTMTQQLEYDYPASPVSISDAPTYTKQTHRWDTMSANGVVASETSYDIRNDSSYGIPSRVTTVTQPTGTKSIQWSYNYAHLAETHPDKFKDGLIYKDETRDAADNSLSKSEVEWQQGDYDSPRPSVTRATNGEIDKTTRTQLTYGAKFNQVIEARDYGYADELLRVTKTEYENSQVYLNRHIFNLVKATEVYAAGSGETAGDRQSRTEYSYDGATLQDAPGVTSHSWTHNPSAPWYEVDCECDYECIYPSPGYGGECYFAYVCRSKCMVTDYDASTQYRGLVTQVKTYANAANLSDAIIENRTYDITGNLRTASTSCCELTSLAYSDATQYAYPDSQTRGAVSDANLQVTTRAVYDFNTGLLTSATDADGLASTTSYHAATLRPVLSTAPTGAMTSFEYHDAESRITETVRLGETTNPLAGKSVKYLNGLGQVRREEVLGEGVTDIVETEYDNVGRAYRQSRPFRGSPSAEEKHWTTSYFDALGRTYKVVAPDLSASYAFYNGKDADTKDGVSPSVPDAASGAAGETTLSVDAWGRARWGRTDAQGRLVEVVEPDANGNGAVTHGGTRTEYDYDVLGRLTRVRQATNVTPNGVQVRRFAYDSVGRLTRQKLAETTATLNHDGQYVGASGAGAVWSEAFRYDARSNMTQRTDARGVTTNFNYHDDPLNRLHGVSYTAPPNSGIPAAADISYRYVTKAEARRPTGVSDAAAGDITKLHVVTAGGSIEEYDYELYGRVSTHKQSVAQRPEFRTDYLYDTLDRVTDVRYPAQYGDGRGATRKIVHHSYGMASRLTQLTVGTSGADSVVYASGIAYNAAGQTTQMTVGNGDYQVTETYAYHQQTGLLENQKVVRGNVNTGTKLLNLSYDYVRAGTSAGRTGHLTKITNHLDRSKDKSYAYDALGRLVQVGGGNNAYAPAWSQRYAYDRFGNRTGVTLNNQTAHLNSPVEPNPQMPSDQLALRHTVELPDELKSETTSTDASPSVSDSPFSIFSRTPSSSLHKPAVATAESNVPAELESSSREYRKDDEARAADAAGDDDRLPINRSSSAPPEPPTRNTEAASTSTAKAMPTRAQVQSASGSASAMFVRTDRTTRGNWRGAYGTDGYLIPGESASLPGYAQVGCDANGWVLGADDNNLSHLQRPSGAGRSNGYWYDPNPVEFNINITDGRKHQIALYFVDGWTGWNGSNTIEIVDAATGAVLTTKTVSEYQTGKYMVFEIGGHVRIRATAQLDAGEHALVHGLFFDAGAATRLAAYWRFDEASGATTADAAGNGAHGTLYGAVGRTAGRVGSGAVSFSGANSGISTPNMASLADIRDNFTVAFWAKPTATHEIDAQSTTGINGVWNQRYVIGPDAGGAGVSVGTNGVSVYEHAANYMPAVLVHQAQLTEWTHIAVVYEDGKPRLYLNGQFVKEGVRGSMASVATRPIDIGGMGYGYYAGGLDELRIYKGVVTDAEIRTLATGSAGTGLRGEYYSGTNFETSVLTRTDTRVDFDWGAGSPATNVAADNFSVKWTGEVEARYSERYTFYTHTDDGVRLWVDGRLLIDNWTDHGLTEDAGGIQLEAGRRYAVRMEYYERGGGAAAKLLWSSASQAKESVPPSQLYTPTATGGGGASVPRDGHQSLAYDQTTNRITTAGFEYDEAGNQTRMKRGDGAWQRMVYDAANRLVAVTNDASTAAYERYAYAVGNHRITSESGGTRTYYAGGGGQAAVEYVEAVSTGNLTWAKTYIYAGGSVLATITPGGASEYVEYHHPDRLGTRLISNNQNTNVQEQETLPYGAAVTASGSTRQFTSYDRSASTGLDYAVNRRYDSLQGRFTQVDPIGMQASSLADPQTLNLYAYCGNDPVNHVDPDGLFFKKLIRGLKKIGKWIKVVVAIVIAVLAVISFATGNITGGIQLAIESGRLFADAFGNQRLAQALGRAGAYFNAYVSGGSGTGNYWQDGTELGTDVGGCGMYDNPCDYGVIATTRGSWYRRAGRWVWEHKGEIALEAGLTLVPWARVGSWVFRAGRWGYRAYRVRRAGRLGDLTFREAVRIQGVVDRAGRPLEVVGSAASGTRRGVGTGLPIGKGPGTRSDIDYLVPPSSSSHFQGLEGRLPSLDLTSGIIPGSHNRFIGPAIRFEPRSKPFLVPAGN